VTNRVPLRKRAALGLGLLLLSPMAVAVGCSSGDGAAPPDTTNTTVPPETTTTAEPPLSAGTQVFFYVPEPGECIDKRTPDPTKTDEVILKLDCPLPHELEVFGSVDVPTKDFPGEPAMQDQAKVACPKLFASYVGVPYETSRWEMGYLVPSLGTWANTTKHVVGCYLYDKTGAKLEGTKKGSAV
jgi:hypothetical protein